jgi:spoIIIJ-associated protein
MKKIVVTGKSIEEALKKGLSQLNTTEDRVKVTVIEQPSKGLFGLIGAREAKLELELVPDPIEESVKFLHEVFAAMGLDVSVEQKRDKDGVVLNMRGSDLGMLIGRRGQTLDALQYLVNIVANRHASDYVRIILDAEHFRERRKKTLEELSLKLAARVVRTKKEIMLEPMSPQERKIIHSHLQNHPAVRTYSQGEEPNRRVVICLK